MTEKHAPPPVDAETSETTETAPEHHAKKPYDPHAFHPEKFRDHTVMSPAFGAGHNHTPGSVPLSPETHEPSE